jgi:hypothetical protein
MIAALALAAFVLALAFLSMGLAVAEPPARRTR